MEDVVFFLGQLAGYVLILFWCYSAVVTSKFIRQGITSPFIAEHPPRKKEDPLPPPATRPKKLTYTVAQGQEVLGVSLGILKSYIASGDIRTYKEGEELLLDAEDVVTVSKKPPKRVFPVVDDFKEEHKINNPVEFDD